MRGTGLLLFVRRELAHAVRARWFLLYSGVFLAAGVLLAAVGLGDTMVYGYRGFARALAGLVHLALLFVPLMALIPASAAIAEERESGTLEYVLSQPVAFGQVFLGKWAGVSLGVLLSLAVGYGAAGSVAIFKGVPATLVLSLFAYLLLLAAAFVALGLLLSATADSRARATTLGLLFWLAFVALGTLGIMGAFVRWRLPASLLVGWSFVNPVEAFRLGVLTLLDPDLSLLGPVGVEVLDRFGQGGIRALSAISLIAWTAAATAGGWALFRARPEGLEA